MVVGQSLFAARMPICNTREKSARNKIYRLNELKPPSRPPFFKMGQALCGRRSTLLAWFAEREAASQLPLPELPEEPSPSPAPPKFNLKRATKAQMRERLERLERLADAAAE